MLKLKYLHNSFECFFGHFGLYFSYILVNFGSCTTFLWIAFYVFRFISRYICMLYICRALRIVP